jgi:hypothetical protein
MHGSLFAWQVVRVHTDVIHVEHDEASHEYLKFQGATKPVNVWSGWWLLFHPDLLDLDFDTELKKPSKVGSRLGDCSRSTLQKSFMGT